MSFIQLEMLNRKLLKFSSLEEKISCLREELGAESLDCLEFLTTQEKWIAWQLLAIGQADGLKTLQGSALKDLISSLKQVDDFYDELGGLIGYQVEILRRIQTSVSSSFEGAAFESPYFYDISKESELASEAAMEGLKALPKTAEFYPLGGAADRLHLVDPDTGSDLPAAKMLFAGVSLFEGLIRDVQAREFLYEQVYGKKITVPIGIMTSQEKDNHRWILQMCESNGWFGRPKESFRIFCQPLVPAVDDKGNWIWIGKGKLLLKPGGHGALWKVAKDAGVLSWLRSQGIEQILVRQVNNPLAGVDSGLLAFLGLGARHKMAFGFVSCPRLLKSAEGVNVLVERRQKDCMDRVLTNIEYCDFARFGIEDAPVKEGEIYSRFTGNANILFARLDDLEKAVQICPYPGLLINLKPASCVFETGEKKTITLGRLESTMQNMADVFVEKHPLNSPSKTDRTFVMYNVRKKTISTAKKAYTAGGPFQETPEQSFYDFLQISRELLESSGFSLPPFRSIEETEAKGPAVTFLYHPALGPLYSIIRQKLKRGSLSLGSELQLELAQAELQDVQIEGSLRVLAERPMESKCTLRRVKVQNKGVDWTASRPFWKHDWKRFETAEIILQGKSEFIAEDVALSHGKRFVVEDGVRMTLLSDGKVLKESAV